MFQSDCKCVEGAPNVKVRDFGQAACIAARSCARAGRVCYDAVARDNGASGQPISEEWLREFDAAARRSLSVRMRYAFIRTYKPVLDDAAYRAFDTMEEYRR